MNNNLIYNMEDFRKEKEFYIGIDSDGCVFDTMEIKHKHCFVPKFIEFFNLQQVAEPAREVWEYVNLYSRTRGINRFKGLASSLELLSSRMTDQNTGFTIPQIPRFKKWVDEESKLGHPALEKTIQMGSQELQKILDWSLEVNQLIKKAIVDLPPYNNVREGLNAAAEKADLIVISTSNTALLEKEWGHADLTGYVKMIAGQEAGNKETVIRTTADNRYTAEHVLMIGDSLGDYEAAKANGALFYPILPGKEKESWKRFTDESIHRFFEKTYKGTYEEELFSEFLTYLPQHPPWKR